jgi:hypothetical protein
MIEFDQAMIRRKGCSTLAVHLYYTITAHVIEISIIYWQTTKVTECVCTTFEFATIFLCDCFVVVFLLKNTGWHLRSLFFVWSTCANECMKSNLLTLWVLFKWATCCFFFTVVRCLKLDMSRRCKWLDDIDNWTFSRRSRKAIFNHLIERVWHSEKSIYSWLASTWCSTLAVWLRTTQCPSGFLVAAILTSWSADEKCLDISTSFVNQSFDYSNSKESELRFISMIEHV